MQTIFKYILEGAVILLKPQKNPLLGGDFSLARWAVVAGEELSSYSFMVLKVATADGDCPVR